MGGEEMYQAPYNNESCDVSCECNLSSSVVVAILFVLWLWFGSENLQEKVR